ncbi:MAG: DNA primase [Candidatus Moeniiplasma glomeromycotorum]|nr:DNA primase [Candidatus Moeniiplasma glomeromycotorum]MCE8168251.1 DNA primase [Candidatus Moeniiplasma glomeromycotorum]
MRYRDLLNTNDILNLLTKQLNFTLKQVGRSVFFLCPFHSDKNPSCSFEPNRKIFTCFTCNFKASDIFNFWAQYKKISLEAAVEEIGKLGYFSLSVLDAKKNQEQKGKKKIFDLLSLIADIYQHNLLTRPGQEVLNYLQNERHLDKKDINHFGLGCSINNWQLSNLLFLPKNDNFSPEELLLTNLVWITENNRVCDFFSAQQLIIPLANPEGKIVAFAARRIGEVPSGEGKYKYLPSYQHYQKSSLLYNYLTAKKSRADECYLVEGFFDVISLHKLGIENCLSPLGTNLSEEQIKLLAILKKRIILFLDNDKAGQEATINTAVKLLLRGIDCEIIKNDYSGDPDEICHQLNQESLQTLLQKRENPYLFILNYCSAKWEIADNPQRTDRFLTDLAKIFRNFKSNIYEFLIAKISVLINWKKEEIAPYFIKWNLPAFNTRHCQIIYCQELILEKEKKIISLCTQERFFWLLTQDKIHFFFTKSNRENYYKVYNYYISASNYKSYSENHSPNELANYLSPITADLPSIEKGKIITATIQELENIQKYLLNYEKSF